ncbi:MAG: isoprenylcysteine carboxylmethyltransferase family protein [archaeon]|nr:isoprenylcysteine carboxylmethyltransferase family protein [archaeon]
MAQIFPSPFEAIVFYIIYAAWIISEIVGAVFLPWLRRRSGFQVKSILDRGSRGVIFLGLFVAIYISFSFAANSVAMLPTSGRSILFSTGILLMLLGIFVRQWAIATLGRFFSLSVRVAQGHKVVSNGPYRFVRHPSYTGALLSFAGMGLVLGSWGALLVILLMFGLVFGYRISVEEKALRINLKDDYVTYMKKTKRLIPYLI